MAKHPRITATTMMDLPELKPGDVAIVTHPDDVCYFFTLSLSLFPCFFLLMIIFHLAITCSVWLADYSSIAMLLLLLFKY